MIRLDERGKQCPLPVVEAKKALEAAAPGEVVEVVVDNEIAVQNLRKMADHKGFGFESEQAGDREYVARITRGDEPEEARAGKLSGRGHVGSLLAGGVAAAQQAVDQTAEPEMMECGCKKTGTVVVLSSNCMGQGDDVLGRLLMKGFVYAIAGQDTLPDTVLMYNSGAFLSCEGSDSVEDLRGLEAQGVEILTCGTCLNHYGLADQLKVGEVTNMYVIVEKLTQAGLVVKP